MWVALDCRKKNDILGIKSLRTLSRRKYCHYLNESGIKVNISCSLFDIHSTDYHRIIFRFRYTLDLEMFKVFCWMILLYSNVQCLELKSRTSSKKVMYVLLCEQKLLFSLIIFNMFWRHQPTNVNMSGVHLAVVMPHSFFNGKEYQKKMYAATNSLSRLEFKVRYYT